MSKSVQTVQKCPKVSKSVLRVQKRPKVSRSVQTVQKCSKASKQSKSVQICVERCPKYHKESKAENFIRVFFLGHPVDGQNQYSYILKLIDIFNKNFLTHFQKKVWPKLWCKRLLKNQCVSVTWPNLLHFSDQDKKGGSLTAMNFLHGDTNIRCF